MPDSGLQLSAPSMGDIRNAAKALRGVALRTPLLENVDVNGMLGGRLLLKFEGAQRTGAFKFRGAYNRIRQMDDAEKQRGVVTYSSGNHAQGVARAAQIFGTTAIIVMPSDVPTAKIEATRALGAQIVTFDRDTQNNQDVVAQVIADTQRVHVPPGADARVMAGGGTVALEIFEQAAQVDALLVPCGSGGLTAASALVARDISPKTNVYAVEPDLFDDTRRSLAAGKRVANPIGRRTICDAIMTPIPNALTFAISQPLLAGALSASDDQVRAAMRFAFEHYKIVVEPGAAVGLAAVLSGKIDIKGKTIATVLTGANIDPARFCALINNKD